MKKTKLLLSGLLLSISLGMILPAVSFAATDTSATSSTDENDADETTDGGEFTWVYDAYGPFK